MNTSPLWMTVRYLADRVRIRARLALDGSPESGALTLEWMIIAALIAAGAVVAATFFVGRVQNYTAQLP